MKYRALLGVVLLLVGCTNVSQMHRQYEAGDHSQLDRIMDIVARPDYPYATRRKAAQVLGQIGDQRAVPVLMAALQDYDQRTTLKQEALKALGKIGDPAAVEPIGRLLDRSLNSGDADLRMSAVEALGQIGGAKAAEILVNALRYYDLLTLREEQRGLRGVFTGEEQSLGPVPPDSLGRPARPPALGLFPDQMMPQTSMFGTPIDAAQMEYNPTPQERSLTHQALVKVGSQAVPAIEQYLNSREVTHTLRQELLAIVGEIQGLPQPAGSDSSLAQ
jgi:hypothetical protein